MSRIISIALLALFFTGSVAAQDLANLKKRVAVVEFHDMAGYGHNIGDGMADMLVTALVESGKFMVIERKQLAKIIAEQGLGMSGMVTPQSAAKVGKLLGAELIVTGSVTEFGTKNNRVGGGLSALSGLNLGLSSQKARAVVDIRLVNTTTGEIIAAKKAEGEESSNSLDNVGISGINFHNSSSWNNTILGKAARKAVDKCVKIISEGMSSIPWQGKILKVSADGTVYMKPGSKAGVQPGMTFWVYHKGEDLIDPDTGISLGSEDSKIGQIQVTGDVAGGKAAKAIVKKGSPESFSAGDFIRVK